MKFARRILRQFSVYPGTPQPARVSKNSPVSDAAIKELHAHLVRNHLHTDPSSMADVIRSYSLSPTALHKAHLAFCQIRQPTLALWNLMIRSLANSDQPIDALKMFDQMRARGLAGHNLTFISLFKASSRCLDYVCGSMIHAHAWKLGFESYLYVCNALIHMYGSCGCLDSARRVFYEMSERDLISWNSLICGYSQSNRFKEVLGLFDAMRAAHVKADSVTMLKVILACSHLGDMEAAGAMVKYIQDNCVKIDVYLGNTLIDMHGSHGSLGLAQEIFDGMEERNIVSWNTMIKAYAKGGDLVAARRLFDEMPKRDVVSWTTMITGYSQASRFYDAVMLFEEMMKAKVKPDEITVATVLSACANVGSIDIGKAVHDYIGKHNVKEDVYVGNSLIDMYLKCGSVQKALEVFREMPKKDSVSWTSVISGLAVNGRAEYALKLFSQMLREKFRPTHGTFVGILFACAHAGLVEKGLQHFESMERDYGLVPEMKHYGCVVDLLSRSGNLDRSYEFIKQMPVVPDLVVWRILLGACKLHGNVVLAEVATNKLLELDPCNSGNYVLSSNTYAGAERWDDAIKIRKMMEESEVKKAYGWSSLEVG